jgi:hypothetical protein
MKARSNSLAVMTRRGRVAAERNEDADPGDWCDRYFLNVLVLSCITMKNSILKKSVWCSASVNPG